MSNEYAIKWKAVDKSLKKALVDQPIVRAMPQEEWHHFLRTIKEDKHGVQRMHKLILASGDGKKSQFHDSALSRLGKFRSEKSSGKGNKSKEEDSKEQKTKQKTSRG